MLPLPNFPLKQKISLIVQLILPNLVNMQSFIENLLQTHENMGPKLAIFLCRNVRQGAALA